MIMRFPINRVILSGAFVFSYYALEAQVAINDSTTFYIKLEPDGIARMRYPSGEVYAEGMISYRGKQQKQEGQWVYYLRNGEVDRVLYYTAGILNGISYAYEENNIIRIEYYDRNHLIQRLQVPCHPAPANIPPRSRETDLRPTQGVR